MVFSSIPSYLDASTFHQENCSNPLMTSETQPAPAQSHGGGIRPVSMVQQAQMANIPMPDTAFKCPRCDSTNTKFCYYNNYSLSQPRHFCKACRRYWTRGGALRDVPVGGGRRRNKRSKTSSSKSQATTNTNSTTLSTSTNGGSAAVFRGLNSPLRFMSPLTQLTDTFTGDMGLSYTGVNSPVFQGTSIFSDGGGTGHGVEPWRLSFFGGVESSSPAVFQFQGGGESSFNGKAPATTAPVKMEENVSRLNPMEQWNPTPAAWNYLSGFSASSNTNPL